MNVCIQFSDLVLGHTNTATISIENHLSSRDQAEIRIHRLFAERAHRYVELPRYDSLLGVLPILLNFGANASENQIFSMEQVGRYIFFF
jgi:hypothetical protein